MAGRQRSWYNPPSFRTSPPSRAWASNLTRRLSLATPVLLTLLSAIAAAQPEAPSGPTIYPELGDESLLSGELGCADVVDCPPRAGFVPFARLQLGQFWMEDEDQWPDEPQSTSYQYGPDQYAADGFDIIDSDGGPDSGAYYAPDFDDLYSLPATLPQVKICETVRIENLEFSLQHLYEDGWVNSRPAWRIGANGWGLNLDVGQLPMPTSAKTPSDPNAGWLRRWLDGFNHANYVSYGVRTVRLVDEYEVDVTGGVLGGFDVQADVDHTNIGPHLTLGRMSRSGRWLFDLSATVLIGYGHANYRQDGKLGGGTLGGAVYNQPLNFNSIPIHNRASEDFLATYAELDFTTSYFLTSHWTLDLTARAFVLGEHFSAEDHIVWSLPDFGISEAKQSHTFAGGNLFVGASYVW